MVLSWRGIRARSQGAVVLALGFSVAIRAGSAQMMLPAADRQEVAAAAAPEFPEAPVPAFASGSEAVSGRVLDLGGRQEAQTSPKPADEGSSTSQNQQEKGSPTAPTEPSLSDLGLTPGQVQGNPQQQALLDRRTHMLKVHQRLGLLTTIPLAATLFSGGLAGDKHGSTGGNTSGRDFHAALGGMAVGMYAATAYYAAAAPKIAGTETKGGIKLHKYLIWIHGPGMVLTPILGVMAFNQENSGQRVHGIASAHAAVADVTIAAYVASIVSVSWPIRIKW